MVKKFETLDALGTETTAAVMLKAAGWPRGEKMVVIVGHQPSLGHAAAKLLSGKAAPLNIKKGALWWFSQRRPKEVFLLAVVSPETL